jgi:hypothetical protein
MSPSTFKLHEHLIRLVRGIVNAWENWLKEQPKQ